ncbi:MAG TPA: MBG domain-containing protein, partial [Chitinophagaceae bacterium]
ANPVPQTFNTQSAAQDVSNGDLPSNVSVLLDFPLRRTDEGRAMMQIIHDVAPGAKKYFYTGFFTAGYFAKAIEILKDSGCAIITDDVTYITEPMLKDGIVAKTVNKVKEQGVSYFTAAGNFANRSYEKDCNWVSAESLGFAPGKKAHNFRTDGGVDMFQKIKLRPGSYTLVFQWVDNIYSAEEVSGTQYDLDIYLTKENDVSGAGLIGYNRDNTFGDPIEFIPITIPPGGDSIYNVLIINHDLTGGPQRLKYVVYKGAIEFLEYNEGNSTIVGQGNAEGAITVGAARFNHVPGHPLLPAALSGITKPQIENFSSLGGTYVTDVNGIQAQRQKPDLVAADGVNTTVRMGQDYPNEALDGWSNFFGTSAAAPHAAAAAALLMEGRKKYLAHHPPVTTPDTMKALLQSTAVDMRPPGLVGYDFYSGAGLIDADSAMRTFAVPEPFQIKLVVPEDTVPGRSSFILKITGENFSNSSVVYVVHSNGDTTTLLPDSITKTEIFVEIPPFEGNPKIMVYTPPITEFGDGGFSNILRFFLPEVVVKAVPVYLKYGQSIPLLDTIITVDDTLIQNTSHTLASIGLASLQVTTNAANYSPVGTYNIDVSRVFDENNPIDSAFLEQFRYSFIDTFLFISKSQVKVVPDALTVKYGRPINNITYKYYDEHNDLITNPALLNQLDSSHRRHMADNALAVINGYPGSPALTPNDLTNLSGMVTVGALKNSRKFKVVNGSLVPAAAADSNRLDLQYIIDVSAESVRNYLNNPAQASLESSFPGINSRVMLSAQKILNGEAGVELEGLVPIVNGELVPVINTVANKFVPLVNKQLVQLVNGAPMELVDGGLVPIVNGDLVRVVNGMWVTEENNGLVPIVNGDLIHVVNGELMKVVNGSLIPVVNGLVQLVNNAGGITLVQAVNGSLNQVVNGSLMPVVNGNLVSVVNGELMKVVNGSLIPVVNGELMKLVNGDLMKLVNGELVHMVNGSQVPLVNNLYNIQIINGNLMQVVNGVLYPLVNGLHPLVNGASGLVPIVNSYSADGSSNTNAVVIIDSTDVSQQNGVLGALFSTNIITGLNVGEQKMVSGALFNTNFDVTYGLGTVTITADTITVKADTLTRPFGVNNPPLTYSLSGFRLGETLQTSGVTGNASLSTTAVPTSPVGTYPITVSQGSLSAANYTFKFVNSLLTVTNNACLLTHSPAKNFGNTTMVPTSLWLNMTTKVSGQLNVHGDYLLFEGGTVTFNNISSTPIVTNLPIPKGRIEADMNVSTPITYFDSLNNVWITKVPVGYSSTSDIFVTGAKINSSNGFVKQGGNSNSVLKGIFYSNKVFSDQWAYGIAAYQPQFYYADISEPGEVVSINGTYRAGTPVPLIPFLVNGASGGGGNSYTGGSSSFENFTACAASGARMMQQPVTTTTVEQTNVSIAAVEAAPGPFVAVNPNPATDRIRISFVPTQTAVSRIEIVTINGTRVFVNELGLCKPGIQYMKEINVNNLPGGLYLVRIWNGSQATSKKIVISH